MTEAVPDSGPVIHLAELDALDVLQDFTLRIVPAVRDEIQLHSPNALQSPHLHLVQTPEPDFSNELQSLVQAFALDRGEADSLALLEKYPEAWFLTDDAAARLAGEHRGHHVHGTIGLLLRSVRLGFRTEQQVLTLLRSLPQKSTLHLRPSFLRTIIERAEQEWRAK